jgi:hypothetical protein
VGAPVARVLGHHVVGVEGHGHGVVVGRALHLLEELVLLAGRLWDAQTSFIRSCRRCVESKHGMPYQEDAEHGQVVGGVALVVQRGVDQVDLQGGVGTAWEERRRKTFTTSTHRCGRMHESEPAARLETHPLMVCSALWKLRMGRG